MAQLFPAYSNTLFRLGLTFFGFIGPVATVLVGSALTQSPFNTKVGHPLAQPVPFSHEHHAVELGIDCRYCHTSVEKSYRAGIPPTETCMSCHSQIWTDSPLLKPIRDSYRTNQPVVWNRLNWVPQFVYFPHNIHVNRGLSCNNCHGPVQKMMLTYKGKAFFMRWCLECHRQPEKYVSPRNFPWKLYQDIQSKGYSIDASGTEGLTPKEAAIANGQNYQNNDQETEEANKLIDTVYHVKKGQLTNCSLCHH